MLLLLGQFTGKVSKRSEVSANLKDNPKNAILIFSPYYMRFDSDVCIRARMVTALIPVPIDELDLPSHINYYQDKIDELKIQAVHTCCMMICNPTNPTGRYVALVVAFRYQVNQGPWLLHLLPKALTVLYFPPIQPRCYLWPVLREMISLSCLTRYMPCLCSGHWKILLVNRPMVIMTMCYIHLSPYFLEMIWGTVSMLPI